MLRNIVYLATLMLVAGCIPKSETGGTAGSAQVPRGSTPQEEAPTLDIAGGCQAESVQRHLGKRFTAPLTEQMLKESGAQKLRMAHENGMITMDYNSGRLNIFYDDANRIVRVDCG